MDFNIASALTQSTYRFQTDGRGSNLAVEMNHLVKSILNPLSANEIPQLNEQAWATLHEFDNKRNGQGHENMLDNASLQDLNRVCQDYEHPCQNDAWLLLSIIHRPLNGMTLEGFVTSCIPIPIADLSDADSRTFNSIQPEIAMHTQNYNSIGRTCLFKGVTHLFGISNVPEDMEPIHQDRQSRLQRCVFQNGPKLTFADFKAAIDPLARFDIYQNATSNYRMPTREKTA